MGSFDDKDENPSRGSCAGCCTGAAGLHPNLLNSYVFICISTLATGSRQIIATNVLRRRGLHRLGWAFGLLLHIAWGVPISISPYRYPPKKEPLPKILELPKVKTW